MKRQRVPILVLMLSTASCSTASYRSDRIWTGSAIGLAVGAGGGAALSPNDESRGLNALVFGLSGAIVGGVAGALTGRDSEKKVETPTLEERERQGLNETLKDFPISTTGDLPAFLKNRVTPAVVEEYLEQDSVGEDGSLHEPHKVYRIKRQAELIARPEAATTKKSK